LTDGPGAERRRRIEAVLEAALDGRHSALVELAFDPVAAVERRIQSRDGIGHRPK
jgi:hypothetical protein